MKQPKYAKVPENAVINMKSRFTVGQTYLIDTVEDREESCGVVFTTKNNNGEFAFCIEKECGHLNGFDWKLIYE